VGFDDGLVAAPGLVGAAEGVVGDEGVGDVGRALDADDPALLAGVLADELAAEELAGWSGVAVSHVDDSLTSLSGVVLAAVGQSCPPRRSPTETANARRPG
jgi:hypothetical protein